MGHRLLVPALWLAAALGCTAPAPHYIAEGQEGAPGVHRVLLCPANLALALDAEISGGVEPVQQQLVAYLEAQGLEVERLGLREGRSRWRNAVAQAKQEGAPAAGTAFFARGLAEGRDFQALLMPSLLLFSVRVTDSSGTWDGVRRRLAMVNRPSRGSPDSADTFSKGVSYGGITGNAMATSLHVMVFSRDGKRVFEGRGGLDFVQEIDLAGANDYHWEFRMKPGLLRDPEVVREGVEIALSPYLPQR